MKRNTRVAHARVIIACRRRNLVQIENNCWLAGLFFRQLYMSVTLSPGGSGRDSFGQHLTKRIEAQSSKMVSMPDSNRNALISSLFLLGEITQLHHCVSPLKNATD